ncbi:type IV secretion system protein [Limnobacter alexandrii]|uniref:type IV secretion system protein n=1 Tax=Limnobacter alexandrii TaxID=2570352 RepID=UPI001109CB39|nr:type IV secretion system protein [Limnobacter alexandrii]
MFRNKKKSASNFHSLANSNQRPEQKLSAPRVPAEKIVNELGNAPITAFNKAKYEFFEVFADPIVDKNRYFAIIGVLSIIVIGLLVLFSLLLPLKTIDPWVIEVAQTGQAVSSNASTRRLDNFKPGAAEISYFLKEWTTKLLRIDPYLVRAERAAAYEFTRGKAQEEFRDWLKKDRPFELITEDPGFTRSVEFNTVTPGQSGVAFVRVQTTDRPTTGKTTRVNRLLTIHYGTAPSTDPRILLENPLGFYVTHFEIQEELLQ